MLCRSRNGSVNSNSVSPCMDVARGRALPPQQAQEQQQVQQQQQTEVQRQQQGVQQQQQEDEQLVRDKADIAASFQYVATLHLVERLKRAVAWAREMQPDVK